MLNIESFLSTDMSTSAAFLSENDDIESVKSDFVPMERIFALMRSHKVVTDDHDTNAPVASIGIPHSTSVPYSVEHLLDDEENDVRKLLFDSIPEYPHPTDFQRVVITTTNEPLDFDTIEACKDLRKCMDLRAKWLGQHPFPPQDVDIDMRPVQSLAVDLSLHGTSSQENNSPPPRRKYSEVDPSLFRRRLPPEYNVFDRPLPPASDEYSYEMKQGNLVISLKDGRSPRESAAFKVSSYEDFIKDFNLVSQV